MFDYGRIVLVVAVAICGTVTHGADSRQFPNGYAWGCYNISRSLPFCNHTLDLERRLDDLVSRLNITEKLGLLSPDLVHTKALKCSAMDPGVPRLGIPAYLHLVEANTAVAAECLSEDKCATQFPGPTGLGATFNRSLWRAKGKVIGTEMRAFNNIDWHRGTRDSPYGLIGLNGYGPNINMVRDPRWGRNSEVPGEDPYLSGQYAIQFVQGAQQGSDPRWMRMTLGLKHFTAYSMETDRDSFVPNVSALDLWDFFLPAFKAGLKEGHASGVMCSYAGVNGTPSCANSYLLDQVLRGKFGSENTVVASDCKAVDHLVKGSHYAANYTDAAAKAMNGGTDWEFGSLYWAPVANGGTGDLEKAMDAGSVTMARLDKSVRRVLRIRFRTGQFDPIEDQLDTQIGEAVINASSHHDLVLDAALQSLVLLRNDEGVLPISQGRKLAVLGPHIISTKDLFSDYPGDMECFDGTANCIPTIAQQFRTLHGENATFVELGVALNGSDTSGIASALAAAQQSDHVILCLGLSADKRSDKGDASEHEHIDRNSTVLPGLQEQFALDVLALGKPTTIVLINGGILSVDSLAKHSGQLAIVEAFYPGRRGAQALYLSLFGIENRWGKLPVTVYDSDYIHQVGLRDFAMSQTPGRTYRWYTGSPLYPFGHGLSLTKFVLSCDWLSGIQIRGPLARCMVKNIGSRRGDEVVMQFHRVSQNIRQNASHPIPKFGLVGFERVSLWPGESIEVDFPTDVEQSAVTTDAGDLVTYRGVHFFDFVTGAGPNVTLSQQESHTTFVDYAVRPAGSVQEQRQPMLVV